MNSNRINNAESLIRHIQNEIIEIEAIYNRSLEEQYIDSSLLIRIKNYLGNIRSILDYAAVEIAENYSANKKIERVDFPYATRRTNEVEYRKKLCKEFPGLEINNKEIFNLFLSVQHFSSKGNKYLPELMGVINYFKHINFIPQIKIETKELHLKSGNVSMTMGHGGGIKIAPGGKIFIGEMVISGGQEINVVNPAKFTGKGEQYVLHWVNFAFSYKDINVSALPLLKGALDLVSEFIRELKNIISKTGSV